MVQDADGAAGEDQPDRADAITDQEYRRGSSQGPSLGGSCGGAAKNGSATATSSGVSALPPGAMGQNEAAGTPCGMEIPTHRRFAGDFDALDHA